MLGCVRKPLFLVSLVPFILAVLGQFAIAALAPYVFWLAIAASVVLAISCLMTGV
ncbi:MAG: hypothetical protein P1U81_14680 [Verrucomicrobiales bacterium]|nr:hypothetical protein [Verrucomicrobiales bacterium]